MAYCRRWPVLLLAGLFFATDVMAEKVTVFAASSLTNALQDIAAQYKKTHNVTIVTSYASSSTLARQIVQGAPADLFISADRQWMDYAQNQHVIDNNSVLTLLSNHLVLVAPLATAQPVTLNNTTDWRQLLQGRRLATGDPDHVPVGIYAKQALQTLGAWRTVSPLMVRGNSVRAALALVELGEVPYGIVYRSDAVASNKVSVVGTFPPDSYGRIEYRMAKVKNHDAYAVDGFWRYLQGQQAAAVFQHYGFLPAHDQ